MKTFLLISFVFSRLYFAKHFLIETYDQTYRSGGDYQLEKISTTRSNDWTRNMYGSYKDFTAERCKNGCNIDEAYKICNESDANLVVITNKEENAEIKKMLGSGVSWLSIHSKFIKGAWQHHNTATSAKYFNFATEENPDEKRCAIMEGGGNGQWIKVPCESKDIGGKKIGVICMRVPEETKDSKGRAKMGKSACDDGQKLIENDLKMEKVDAKCESQNQLISLTAGKMSTHERCQEIPKGYVPNHICINETVEYPEEVYGRIPTFGPHRPNWAKFGEYSYLPIERYQHNIEHGCVVLLYHPCLVKSQVRAVVDLLNSCIRKQVSTPSRLPTREKPIVLLAWGCMLEVDALDMEAIEQFIIKNSYGGPEGHFPKDGLYDHNLVKAAKEGDDFGNKPKSCLGPSLREEQKMIDNNMYPNGV